MAKRGKIAAPKEDTSRPIEQYAHTDKQRLNNPPVGLVTPDSENRESRKVYRYDPHLDPALSFDPQPIRQDVADAIHEGLREADSSAKPDKGRPAATLAEAKWAETQARLVQTEEALARARKALLTLRKMQEPFVNWAGKAERLTFEVPTVSLHVHERIDPRTIIEAVRRKEEKRQPGLFDMLPENPPLREAIDFYRHPHNWSNRLIAGDSLMIMNSLLEKEGMAGKVQMVYIDPPYGIKYGSNFQPFVNRRDVKDGKDEDLTTQPEMIKAFRDTWELGIHSYLANLRDRLLLAKELLHESGSCFVQISDENLHHVREIMDEVFGADNFVGLITFSKTTSASATLLSSVSDYLVWYARDVKHVKYRRLFLDKEAGAAGGTQYTWAELPDGTRLNCGTVDKLHAMPPGCRPFVHDNLTSQRPSQGSDVRAFTYEGKPFTPGKGTFKTDEAGLHKLANARRLIALGDTLRYVRFLADFPVFPISNLWDDTVISGFADPKRYVVQTSTRVAQRCMLMTTDPGDLVFDPTCGSGTTAFVAEQWGRRWITCDTSRVAVTLAKQRLMTATFDYFKLAHPKEGVGSGFVCKTVPHVTLKSIANNPEIKEGMNREAIDRAIAKYADQETLYDQPERDPERVRVTGPFTVEAVPAPTVRAVGELSEDMLQLKTQDQAPALADASVARTGATLRADEWRQELLKTGVRGRSGQRLAFTRVEPLGGTRYLHADAETKGDVQRVVVSFGPEFAPLEQKQVELAWEEARKLVPRPAMILFVAYQFDPEAARDIDELSPQQTGMQLLKVQMNTDLLTGDLKKNRASNESFWFIGQPDVSVTPIKKGPDAGKYQVEVRGFDYYNPVTGSVESGDTARIAVWMLDPDYDGRSLYPRQVFFPLAGADEGWARLARTLRAEIDEDLIEQYRGTTSLPFAPGKNKRVAVKIVDDRGIESLKVVELQS